jgi:hypothetical protein
MGANNMTFNGIAPNANISSFRVFGCSGHRTTAVVLDVLKDAMSQRIHTITLSEIK